jgi:hypothetical protein
MAEPLEMQIRRREAQLKARHPRVRACSTWVEDRPPHPYQRKRFNARLDIDFAGHQIVINREHDDDPAAALREAFAAAERELDALADWIGVSAE